MIAPAPGQYQIQWDPKNSKGAVVIHAKSGTAQFEIHSLEEAAHWAQLLSVPGKIASVEPGHIVITGIL